MDFPLKTKRLLTFLLLFALTSACGPAPTLDAAATLPTPSLTQTASAPTPSRAASTPTVTASPLPPPTGTPVPCDPLAADYCITDGHFIFQRPIHPPANDSADATYPFASTAEGTREPHHGVEFPNATGTPVFAAADGTVVFAGPDAEAAYSPWTNFYGNVIVIRHADGMFTLYAHLSALETQAGQQVAAGQEIGKVGKTGGAIGSHLHFEVRRGDAEDYFSALNPQLWMIPRADEGALAISIVNRRGDFQRADLTIQTEGASYYIRTYEENFLSVDENAALGELKPGRYRITFYYGGLFYERRVEVQSGKLTLTTITLK